MPVDICGMRAGAGIPKVIVPVMGANEDEILAGVAAAVSAGADCIEWRADYCEAVRRALDSGDMAELVESARRVVRAAGSIPLLFTVRSAGQGGALAVSADAYRSLISAVIEGSSPALLDIELNMGDALVSELIDRAREKDIASVVSLHDFEKTPETAWMVETLRHMHELGASVPKLAVMAQARRDALRLLDATSTVVFDEGIWPVITMAMGEHGGLTRLLGEGFGSAMTFAALGEASAPGQMSLSETRSALIALHEALA